LINYDPDAREAIQSVYDDPQQEQLADRLEELLDLLDRDPGDQRLRRHRMHEPALWLVKVYGSKRDFAFLWELQGGQPWIHWAGDF